MAARAASAALTEAATARLLSDTSVSVPNSDELPVQPNLEAEPLSPQELDFHKSVEEFFFLDWAQEQQADPRCRVTIIFIRRGCSTPFPVDILRKADPHPAPSTDDVTSLAEKSDIRELSSTVRSSVHLLVRREPSSSLRTRIFVPMMTGPWLCRNAMPMLLAI